MCLLDLFLRVQLNLLGSHVYLSAALRDPKENSTHTHSGGPTPAPGHPALSLAAQHAYLALHSHFIREGTKMLVPTLAAHCQAALAECVMSLCSPSSVGADTSSPPCIVVCRSRRQ